MAWYKSSLSWVQLFLPCVLLTSHVGYSCVDFRRSSHLTYFHSYATYRPTFRVATGKSKHFTENDLVFDPQRGTLHWAFWRWITAQLGWSRLTWNNFGLTLHIALSRFVRFLEKQKPGNWHWTLNANMLSPVCKGDRSLYERGNNWSTIFDWPGWVLPCELLPFWCRWWNPSAFVARCLPRAHLFLEGFLTVQWATCIDSMVQPLWMMNSVMLHVQVWRGIIFL